MEPGPRSVLLTIFGGFVTLSYYPSIVVVQIALSPIIIPMEAFVLENPGSRLHYESFRTSSLQCPNQSAFAVSCANISDAPASGLKVIIAAFAGPGRPSV
jgi:hypothetical protein